MLKIPAIAAAILIVPITVVCQAQAPLLPPDPPPVIADMARDVSKISTSMEKLAGNWKSFFEAFSTNQGLQLTPAQQRILLALEVLNRTEQRLANLQKMRMDLTEKQTVFRLQLARITDDLLPESIERSVSVRGTLDAERARDIRRQALMRERTEITTVISQIQRDLITTNEDIRETERFIQGLRHRLFPQIEKELIDL